MASIRRFLDKGRRFLNQGPQAGSTFLVKTIFNSLLSVAGGATLWTLHSDQQINTSQFRTSLVDKIQKEYSKPETGALQKHLGKSLHTAIVGVKKDHYSLWKSIQDAAKKLRSDQEAPYKEWKDKWEQMLYIMAENDYFVTNEEERKELDTSRRAVTQYWEYARYTMLSGVNHSSRWCNWFHPKLWPVSSNLDKTKHQHVPRELFENVVGKNGDRLHLFFLVCHPLNLKQNYTDMPERVLLADTERGRIREEVTRLTQWYLKECEFHFGTEAVFSVRALGNFQLHWSRNLHDKQIQNAEDKFVPVNLS